MIELTEKEVKTLKEERKVAYRYFVNIKEDKKNEEASYETEFVCGCKQSEGKIQKIREQYPQSPQSTKCQYCNKEGYHMHIVYSEKYAENIKKYNRWWRLDSKERVSLGDVFYVKRNPDEEHGMIIYNLSCHTKILKDEETGNFNLDLDYAVKNYSIITPGKEFKGYKCQKRADKEIDLFDSFLINSQNINLARPIVFEDCSNIFDFFDNNPEFTKKIGIKTALQHSTDYMQEEAFFLLHLALIGTHPILELLIKMGYIKLYFDVVLMTKRSYNKADIKNNIKNLNKLLNNETTKGTMALRIPAYIGNYLNTKNSGLEEYYTWCDIYELQPLSKEQFEKYIDSNAYLAINLSKSLASITNIMKYGYTIEKASNYVYKQSNKREKSYSRYHWYSNSISNIINLMVDYLDMCDMYGFEADKYPSDIITVHDRMVDIRIEREEEAARKSNEEKEKSLRTLSDSIYEYMGLDKPETLPEIFKKYTITIPSSINDFVNEGNAQHNCVGGYYRSVVAQKCVIFFVRKTDNPEESFITAEYTCKGNELGQYKYKNNRDVTDVELIEFGKSICSKIKTGIRSGKIHW